MTINYFELSYRISSLQSGDNDPSVLVNGHFDTTPGSPGAGDCGSCVGRFWGVFSLLQGCNNLCFVY